MIEVQVQGGHIVEFPDNTPQETIANVLRKNFAANSVAPNPSQYEGFPEMTPLVKLGRGFMDAGQGIKQLYLMATDKAGAERYTKQKDDELGLYEEGRRRAGETGIDWTRLGGNVLATAPAMLIPGGAAVSAAGRPAMLARTLSGAAQGALASGAMYAPEDTNKGGQVALGAFGGAAAPWAVKGVSSVAGKAYTGLKRIGGRVANVLDDRLANGRFEAAIEPHLNKAGLTWGEMADDVRSGLKEAAAEQLRSTGRLSPESLARKAAAESLGFVDDSAPTTGQLTRQNSLWARERNLAKLEGAGDELTQRFTQQDLRLKSLGEQMQAGTRATGTGDVGEQVLETVTRKSAEMQDEVGKLYGQIRTQYGDTGLIRPNKMLTAADELADNADYDSVMESIVRRMKRLGLVDKEGAVTGQGMTVRQAEELRKFVRGLPANNPTRQLAVNEIIEGLDDDVIESVGDDFFKEARNAARLRFQEFGNPTLKRMLEGRRSIDDVLRMDVIGGKTEGLLALKKTLNTGGEKQVEAGTQVWDNVRGSIVEWVWNKATTGDRLRGVFNGKAFKNALTSIGEKKLRILFNAEEYKMLQRIGEVGTDLTYTPPGAPVNFSNTMPAAFNVLQSIGRIPNLSSIGEIGKRGANSYLVRQALEGRTMPPGLLADEARVAAEAMTGLLGRFPVAPTAGILGGYAARP